MADPSDIEVLTAGQPCGRTVSTKRPEVRKFYSLFSAALYICFMSARKMRAAKATAQHLLLKINWRFQGLVTTGIQVHPVSENILFMSNYERRVSAQ
jgi:hypothetical protein